MGPADHGVKPLDFPLLADENIAPDVVSGLRSRGHDVRSVWDEALVGRPDADVVDTATRLGRVVVTHDVAFGRSAIRAGTSFVGIVYRATSRRRSCSTSSMPSARPLWMSNRRSSRLRIASSRLCAFACGRRRPGNAGKLLANTQLPERHLRAGAV